MRQRMRPRSQIILALAMFLAGMLYISFRVAAPAGSSCLLPNYLCACDPNCQGTYEEANDFNTIDDCQDGSDESTFEFVEKMIIRGFNQTKFRGGDMVEVYGQYFCYEGDPISIAYTNNSNGASTVWRNIHNDMCTGYNYKDFFVNYTLDDSEGMHAFRFIISYPGNYGLTCGQVYTSSDTDDIEIWVQAKPDTSPPSVTIVSPTAGAYYEKSESLKVPIRLSVSDPSGIANVTMRMTWPNGTLLVRLNSTAGNFYDYNITGLADLVRYNLTFISNDTLNNTRYDSSYFYLVNNATLSIASPEFSKTYRTRNIPLNVRIFDNSLPYSRVYYTLNSGSQQTLEASVNINVSSQQDLAAFNNEYNNLSQSFTADRDMNLDYLTLMLKKTSPGNVTIQLRQDSGGGPGTVLAYGTAQTSGAPSFTMVGFALNGTVSVSNNTGLWIYIEQNGSFTEWQASQSAGYGNGSLIQNSTYDGVFTVYDRTQYIADLPADEGLNSLQVCEINKDGDTECSISVFTADTIAPSASSPAPQFSPFEIGDVYQFIYINLTDVTSSVDKVRIETNYTGNTTMDHLGGQVYRYRWTVNRLGIFDYRISYNDTAGNPGSTSYYSFVSQDGRAPSLSGIGHYPASEQALDPNVSVRVNATVSDDSSLNQVVLEYTSWNGTWSSVQMTNTSNLFNGSFMPVSTGTWGLRVRATDVHGNVNISNTTNVSVYFDYTWQAIPQEIMEVFSTQGKEIDLGNISINNTGDMELNISLSKIFGIPLVSLSASSVQVQPGQAAKVNLTAISPEQSSVPYPVVIGIDCNTPGCLPETTNVTGSIAVGQGGPFITIYDIVYDPSVKQGDRNILLNATIRNIGNETAVNLTLNWSLPAGFTTNGNLSKYIGNVTPYSTTLVTFSYGLLSSVSTSAEIGESDLTVTAGYYTPAYTQARNSAIRTIIISMLETQETVVIIVPPSGDNTGGGGGGGGGAPRGGGGAGGIMVPRQTYELKAEYPATISLTRGQSHAFSLVLSHEISGVLFESLSAVITGIPVQKNITPEVIPSIVPGHPGVFNISLSLPLYLGYGTYDMNLTVKGMLRQSSSEEGSAYSQTLPLKVIVTELDMNETMDRLLQAENLIARMKEDNLSVSLLERSLKDARSAMALLDYNMAEEIITGIRQSGELAYRIRDRLRQLHDETDRYANEGYDLSPILKMLAMAQDLFEKGDYLAADERLEAAEESLNLQVVSEENKFSRQVSVFIRRFWPGVILFLVLTMLAALKVYSIRRKSLLKAETDQLAAEQKIIEQKISDLQKRYFKDRTVSPRYYQQMAESYNSELGIIRQKLIKMRHLDQNDFRIAETKDGLLAQRKEIESAIKELQLGYFGKQTIDRSTYASTLKIYQKRLADIDKLLMISPSKSLDKSPGSN